MRKFALSFCILFLLVSCEKESVTEITNSGTEDNQVSLKGAKTDIPSDNAVVARYEGSEYFGVYDSKRDLTAWIGLDFRIACAGDFEGSLDVYTIQEIYLEDPDELIRIIRLINAEATVSVFNGLADPPCGMEPIWEGTAHLIATDNDVVPNGPNFNSWGLTAIGDGLSINFRVVWNGDWENPYSPVGFTNIRVK